MNLAATFKDRARELGVTHAELATVLGCNRQSIYRKLNGRTPMTVGEAWQLAEHLGLKLNRLLKEEPDDA